MNAMDTSHMKRRKQTRKINGRRPPKVWPAITPDQWEKYRVGLNSRHRKGWDVLPPDDQAAESLTTNREYCPRLRLTKRRRDVLQCVADQRIGDTNRGMRLAEIVRELGLPTERRRNVMRILEALAWGQLIRIRYDGGGTKKLHRVLIRGRLVLAGTRRDELPIR